MLAQADRRPKFDACKLAFEKRIPTLEQIADREKQLKGRIDEIKALVQYGRGLTDWTRVRDASPRFDAPVRLFSE